MFILTVLGTLAWYQSVRRVAFSWCPSVPCRRPLPTVASHHLSLGCPVCPRPPLGAHPSDGTIAYLIARLKTTSLNTVLLRYRGDRSQLKNFETCLCWIWGDHSWADYREMELKVETGREERCVMKQLSRQVAEICCHGVSSKSLENCRTYFKVFPASHQARVYGPWLDGNW